MITETSWDTVIFLGGCLGLANALTVAHTGELIGNAVSRLLGNVSSPFAIFAAMVFLTLMISQFITNSTAIIIVLPTALSLCSLYGLNSMAFSIGITPGASIACCTPLAASQITMTEVAGYEFSDYLKYGWLPSLISYVVIIITVPLFYPLA